MFGIDLGSVITGPFRAAAVVVDDKLKRSAEETGLSLAYSLSTTFLYAFGAALMRKRWLAFMGQVFQLMAAVEYVLIVRQPYEKKISVAVPDELVKNKDLLDQVHFENKN